MYPFRKVEDNSMVSSQNTSFDYFKPCTDPTATELYIEGKFTDRKNQRHVHLKKLLEMRVDIQKCKRLFVHWQFGAPCFSVSIAISLWRYWLAPVNPPSALCLPFVCRYLQVVSFRNRRHVGWRAQKIFPTYFTIFLRRLGISNWSNISDAARASNSFSYGKTNSALKS